MSGCRVVVCPNCSRRGRTVRVCYEVNLVGPGGGVRRVLLRTAWMVGREEDAPSKKIAEIAASALDARAGELA